MVMNAEGCPDSAIIYVRQVDGKKYKTWVHLEEITTDQEGNETFRNMEEDGHLPVQIGEFDSLERAVEMMQEMAD